MPEFQPIHRRVHPEICWFLIIYMIYYSDHGIRLNAWFSVLQRWPVREIARRSVSDGHSTVQPVHLFSKLNYSYFGYFDIGNFFFRYWKITNFRGDLTDISAKKEALRTTARHSNNHVTHHRFEARSRITACIQCRHVLYRYSCEILYIAI